jgi:hypothetical protein
MLLYIMRCGVTLAILAAVTAMVAGAQYVYMLTDGFQ